MKRRRQGLPKVMRLEAMSNDSGNVKGVEGLGKPVKIHRINAKAPHSLLPKLSKDKPGTVRKAARITAPKPAKISPPKAPKLGKTPKIGKAPMPPKPKRERV